MTRENGNYLAFPFHIGNNGKTAQVSTLEEHIRDEIVQIILTNPGERVFLPEFGAGVRRLVFESADETKSGLTKAMITQAISRWLGQRISLEDLTVDIQNETIDVAIKYKVTATSESKVMIFQRSAV
jgi:phage baseplate assembly protein W